MRSLVKKAGKLLHSTVSRNRTLAICYLRALGQVCRALPDGNWKQFVSNSIHSVTWPEFALSPVSVRFPIGDLQATIEPHLGEFDFSAHLNQRLAYEPEVFLWLESRAYNAIVEIGANVGVFSLYLAKRFPAARVYSFEPSRLAFSRLLANVQRNPCPNLVPFNCAIFSTSGFLKFHEPVGHLTNGSFSAEFAGLFSDQVVTTLVPALAASSMADFFESPRVLLKIDVEGAEPHVLAAMRDLILEHRPDLLIEVLPSTVAALNELSFLTDAYRLYSIQPSGTIEQPQFSAFEYRDYALLPKP